MKRTSRRADSCYFIWAVIGLLLSTISMATQAEGPMEGVLVKAKRGTIAISVVSDKQGRYAFPADRLRPDAYTVTARAVGHELSNSAVPVTVTAQGGRAGSEVNQEYEKLVLTPRQTPN